MTITIGKRLIKCEKSSNKYEDYDYICKDSHIISIPIDMYNEIISLEKNIGKPIFMKLVNPNNKNLKLFFGKVVPCYDENTYIFPEWVFNRLNVNDFLNIYYVEYDKVLHGSYIKLKANKSHYCQWKNLKEMFEQKISFFNCINLGDLIVLKDVEFIVTEIRDHDGNNINYTSTFDDKLELDFDIPEDVKIPELTKDKLIKDELTKDELRNIRIQKLTNSNI
jgi:hypothetical protein